MGFATVIADIAPLTEQPNLESPRRDEALFGMAVQVESAPADGFCYVRTELGTEGYAPAETLALDEQVAAAWRKYKKSTVLSPYVDVQRQPYAAAAVAACVPRGGVLVPLGEPTSDGWQKVGMPTGAIGFTRAGYLGEVVAEWSRLAPEDMRWNLVETALAYNGTAYRQGGRTPLGIDAGGLVAMSYLLNGVTIPRDLVFRKSVLLDSIPFERMDEGDLLYFPGSVGMFIGEGRFIHATETPGFEGVTVSSLRPKDPDYRGDLAGHIVAVASLFA